MDLNAEPTGGRELRNKNEELMPEVRAVLGPGATNRPGHNMGNHTYWMERQILK